MNKLLTNTTATVIEIHDTGVTLFPDIVYDIPSQDYPLWIASADIVPFIVSGDIVVSDGENILPKRTAIGLLQDNQIVISEYYTLVQDEDVLVGNGQILYLNDEFYHTDNVPEYLDEHVEEDDPTSVGSD
jgi:hypothetical protein